MIYLYALALLFALLLSSTFSGPFVIVANFAIGCVVAWFVVRKLPHVPGCTKGRIDGFPPLARATRLARNLTRFLVDFLRDLAVSNLVVAKDVWAPKGSYRPLIVEVPTSDLTPFEMMILANRISLTPGTLSSDIADDRSYIVVHAMYDGGPTQAQDLRKPIDLLREGLEQS